MGSKSPVDALVDGLDAVGSILDENLPQIKNRLEDLAARQASNTNDISVLRQAAKTLDESLGDLRRNLANTDVRLEEIMGAINVLTRRLDQLYKGILELGQAVQELSIDSELADTVKMLEDRVKGLTVVKRGEDDSSSRF